MKTPRKIKDDTLIDPQKGEDFCLFYPFEKAFKEYIVPKISPYTTTYYLTYLTLLWAALIILSGYLANSNSLWLLLISLSIMLQYITDMLDGVVGRFKDTGLVKWGYYADHFFDFIFIVSIFIGYHLFLDGFQNYNPIYLFILAAIIVGFMISSYLYTGVSKKVTISFLRIGPSEGRVLLTIFNIILIFNKNILVFILPYSIIISLTALAIVFYFSQKKLWKVDMQLKEELKSRKFNKRNIEHLWK